LEGISLLSGLATPPALFHQAALISQQAPTPAITPAVVSQTITQTVAIPATLTNFSLPLAPPLQLFNPALGTLTSVQVTANMNFTSNIQAQNTSTSSATTITGQNTGSLTITGLPQPITTTISNQTTPFNAAPYDGVSPFFQPPSGVTFPPLVSSSTQALTFTSPSDLAFFTAPPGQTQKDITYTTNTQASATAPGGNLTVQVAATAAASVTVTYTYIPTFPTITQIVRSGVHRQPTLVTVFFNGPPLNATEANNPANYFFTGTGPNAIHIPATSAVYNPTNNSVALTPAIRLNVHYKFLLTINQAVGLEQTTTVVFGGKQSLIGQVPGTPGSNPTASLQQEHLISALAGRRHG
jgi:hypothetical protein